MFYRLLTLAFVLSAIQPQASAQAPSVDRCRVVAELMGHDDSYDSLNMKLRDYVYDEVCEGGSARKGYDFKDNGSFLGYGMKIDGSPQFSSTDEKAEYFCKNYRRNTSLDVYQSGSSKTVVREAITAWQACVTANRHVQIDILSTSPAGFQIQLVRGPENAIFNGLKFHEGAADCKASYAPLGSSVEKVRVVDEKTRFALFDGQQTVISCTRQEKRDNKARSQFLPQITFDVLTSRGSMPVTLRADSRLPGPSYVSEWVVKTQELALGYEARISKLESRKPETQLICNGSPTSHMQDVGEPAACPVGWSEHDRRNFAVVGGRMGIGYKCRICNRITP